jgi:hypothetical protein
VGFVAERVRPATTFAGPPATLAVIRATRCQHQSVKLASSARRMVGQFAWSHARTPVGWRQCRRVWNQRRPPSTGGRVCFLVIHARHGAHSHSCRPSSFLRAVPSRSAAALAKSARALPRQMSGTASALLYSPTVKLLSLSSSIGLKFVMELFPPRGVARGRRDPPLFFLQN